MLVERYSIVNDLQSYFLQFDSTLKFLKLNNDFIPESYFDKKSFGNFYFKEIASNPFKSQILNEKLSFDLIKLCEFSLDDKWSLLYRANFSDYNADHFHYKCDNHTPTLTIVKAFETGNIFGGYTEASWDLNSRDKCDPKAFIFSLTNKDNRTCKMEVIKSNKAIFCYHKQGPVFGGADLENGLTNLRGDIRIGKNNSVGCFSYLGGSYKHPVYAAGTNESKAFLAGSCKFQIDLIEVYQKV